MNKKVVKEFIKENFIWCFLLVFIVFGLGGYRLYQFIENKINENIIYETPEVETENVIKNYGVNEYKIITKSEQDLVEYYYEKIKKMWLNDPGQLYDLMSEKGQSFYEDKNEFVERIKSFITSKTPTSYVAAYKVVSGSITIQTNEDIQIRLKSNGINDYQITLMDQSTR